MKNNKPESQLQTYLVGGAVRDQLLQRKVIEKDYLVVGSTVEQMLSLGFTQVGKDFPVFLHPTTKDEYALARTEKKQGHGYTGFVCYASPDVTLEQDLLRRDLTVNAMAIDNNGNIHDPYHGKQDIQNKLLRHVSPAFSEDPLRVLRVARFAARYHQYGFTVANETMQLMQEISASNELNDLSAERVWQEMSKSLDDHNPQVFFEVLQQSNGLKKIWPELAQQWTDKFSTTDDSVGELIIRTLKTTSEISDKVAIRFAVITTLFNQDDQQIQLDNITKIAKQLKLPNSIQSLAIKTCKALSSINSAMNLNAEAILSLFNQLDVWRKPDEFLDVLLVCKARYLSLNKNDVAEYHQSNYLTNLYQQAKEVNAKEFVEQGLTGVDIKKAIEQKRKNVINNAQLTSFN